MDQFLLPLSVSTYIVFHIMQIWTVLVRTEISLCDYTDISCWDISASGASVTASGFSPWFQVRTDIKRLVKNRYYSLAFGLQPLFNCSVTFMENIFFLVSLQIAYVNHEVKIQQAGRFLNLWILCFKRVARFLSNIKRDICQ